MSGALPYKPNLYRLDFTRNPAHQGPDILIKNTIQIQLAIAFLLFLISSFETCGLAGMLRLIRGVCS